MSISHDDFTWDGKTSFGPMYLSIDNAWNTLDKNGRMTLCCLPAHDTVLEDAIRPVVRSLQSMENGFPCYVKSLDKV